MKRVAKAIRYSIIYPFLLACLLLPAFLAVGGIYYGNSLITELKDSYHTEYKEEILTKINMDMQALQSVIQRIHLSQAENPPKKNNSSKKAEPNHCTQEHILPNIIYDKHGTKIGEFLPFQSAVIDLDQVSPMFIKTLIAVEDNRFFNHEGWDPRGMLRAGFQNIIQQQIRQGGSTITQQLAKLYFWKTLGYTEERTFEQKIIETFAALDIEKQFSKKDILTLYINSIYFGHQVYGIEYASRFFFDKSANELNWQESAFLVGMISNHKEYNPFQLAIDSDQEVTTTKKLMLKSPKKLEIIKQRQNRVMDLMMTRNIIHNFTQPTQKELMLHHFWNEWKEKWMAGPMCTEPQLVQNFDQDMAYVIEEVYRFLWNTYDPSGLELSRGGLKIYTTIDETKQRIAQRTLNNHVYRYRRSLRSYKNAYPLNQVQGALISVNPSTGGIEAMIGGTGFQRSGGAGQINRSRQAYRQVGSAFKPFIYAAAIDMARFPGVPPFSPWYAGFKDVGSIRLSYAQNNKLLHWRVNNYGNTGSNKYITFTEALKKSSNTVVAQLSTYLQRMENPEYTHETTPLPHVGSTKTPIEQTNGMNRLMDLLRESLFLEEDIVQERFPNNQPAIALGTKEMTPEEVAQLYAMLVNKGMPVRTHFISEIIDVNGHSTIYPKQSPALRSAISSETAYAVIQMLRYVLHKGGTAHKAATEYPLNFQPAGKTGTTDNFRDAWYCGIMPELVSVVWIGHDKNHSLIETGGTVAAPVWFDYTQRLVKQGLVVPQNFQWKTYHPDPTQKIIYEMKRDSFDN